MKNKAYVYLILLCSFLSVDTIAVTAKDLFSREGTHYVSLSPNGSRYATLSRTKESQSIEIFKTRDGARISKYQVDGETDKTHILNYSWVDNRYICIETAKEIDGIGNLLDSKRKRKLQFLDTNSSVLKLKTLSTKGNYVHSLPLEKNKFLYEKPGAVSSIYKVDVSLLSDLGKKRSKLDPIDGGQFVKSNTTVQVEEYVVRWFLDEVGDAYAMLSITRDKKVVLKEKVENGEYEILSTWNLLKGKKGEKEEKIPYPYKKGPGFAEYYVVDEDEESEDYTVYLMDYTTKEKFEIYESEGLKVLDLILSDDNEFLGVKVIANDRVEYRYADRPDENTAKIGQERVISRDLEDDWQIVLKNDFDYPGKFELLNTNSAKRKHIAYRNPRITQKLPGTQMYETFKSDGLGISYLLNLPKTKGRKPSPLLVVPHGGPFGVFDTPYYDPEVQFWVAKGYAVLRINYRGSGGKGKGFEEQGKGQYSSGMLDDIVEATQIVMAHSQVSEEEVCIFGASYGGYAAAMLAIRRPDIYRCALSFAGITDLSLFINERSLTVESREFTKEYIGDPVLNYDELKKQSPLYLFSDLKIPLLLLHGQKDKKVSSEHYHRAKLVNGSLKKDIEFVLYNDLGHGFENSEQAQKTFTDAFDFVEKHIRK